jgi:hypothetical protein
MVYVWPETFFCGIKKQMGKQNHHQCLRCFLNKIVITDAKEELEIFYDTHFSSES